MDILSNTKLAADRRALLGTFALFAATALLALMMSHQRAAQPFELRVAPAGWRISFEAPFARSFEVPTRFGHAFTFLGRAGDGATLIVAFHRMEAGTTTDAGVICERAIVDHLTILRDVVGMTGSEPTRVLGSVPMTWPNATLGPFSATHLWDPAVGAIARGTIMRTGEAYVVTLLADRWLDQSIYRLFEATCDSIRRQPR